MIHKTPAESKNQNLLAVLIYVLDIFGLLGIIASIIFLFIKKNTSFVRFHAAQSLITFGGIFMLGISFAYIPGMGKTLQTLLGIGELIIWVILIMKAYKNIRYKLPYIGDLAEALLKKIG